MRVELANSRFPVLIGGGDGEPVAHQLVLIFGIQAEIAIELLGGGGGAIRGGGFAAGPDGNVHRFSDQRAAQGRDEENRRVRIGLGVRGVLHAEDVAGIFEHHVLKSAAGAEERRAVFAGILNGVESSFQAAIRTAGAAEQSLKLREVVGLVGGEPDRFDGSAESFGGMLNSVIGCDVGRVRRVEIANNSDSGGHF